VPYPLLTAVDTRPAIVARRDEGCHRLRAIGHSELPDAERWVGEAGFRERPARALGATPTTLLAWHNRSARAPVVVSPSFVDGRKRRFLGDP
jgi:hypothetical protein